MSNTQDILEQMIKRNNDRFQAIEDTLAKFEIGQGRYIIEKLIVKTGLTDNTATSVFRVETTNETGSTDGGGYAVFVHGLITHGVSSTSSNAATKSFTAHFTRAQKSDGTGVNSAVSEISETGSAATTTLTRDISTVTMTVLETSEYQNDIQFQIDSTGSSATTPGIVLYVRVIWYGYLTAPTVTGL